MSTSDSPTQQLTQLQVRTVRILATGQVLGAISFGVTVSIGALLAASISENDALSGLAAATLTLGAAVTAMPLAALANRRGRRWSLGLGNGIALLGIAVVISSAALVSFPLLLLGFLAVGAGNAGNFQARFAATDLAGPDRRARDLSMVVWATTIGAVLGPNLQGPGEILGNSLGMPALTGAYAFSIFAQVACLLVFVVGLRPDPLLRAREIDASQDSAAAKFVDQPDRPWLARYAIVTIAASHGVMVAVMSMTPIHLKHHGAALTVVGFTISLHIAGMYALSPLFGVLADRWGRLPTILLGQAQLALSLLLAFGFPTNNGLLVASLVLLGTGWSASTVAGAALVSEASSLAMRTKRQGRSDAIMSYTGAFAAAAAGGVLSLIGYAGLALASMVLVIVVVSLTPVAARRLARTQSEDSSQ